jgi:hypothetical protein
MDRRRRLIAAVAPLLVAACGNSAPNSPTATAAPTGDTSPTASFNPADPRSLLTAALTGTRTSGPSHVVFTGSNRTGNLSIDLVIDGHGGAQGKLQQQNVRGDTFAGPIVIANNRLYAQGAALIGLLTHHALPPGLGNHWVLIAQDELGPLESLRNARSLAACIAATAGEPTLAGRSSVADRTLVVLHASGNGSTGTEGDIEVDLAAPRVVRWHMLRHTDGQSTHCPGGITSNPVGGLWIGDITITPAAAVPPQVAPPDVTQLPGSD